MYLHVFYDNDTKLHFAYTVLKKFMKILLFGILKSMVLQHTLYGLTVMLSHATTLKNEVILQKKYPATNHGTFLKRLIYVICA
jgi:hypothetical protein